MSVHLNIWVDAYAVLTTLDRILPTSGTSGVLFRFGDAKTADAVEEGVMFPGGRTWEPRVLEKSERAIVAGLDSLHGVRLLSVSHGVHGYRMSISTLLRFTLPLYKQWLSSHDIDSWSVLLQLGCHRFACVLGFTT